MSSVYTFLAELRQRDVKLWVEEGQLLCDGPEEFFTPAFLAQLRYYKADIMQFLLLAAGDEAWTPLVAIQTAGANPPFFCVHGIGGNVHHLYQLADALGKRRNFYALQAAGVDGKSQPATSIKAMAASYLEAIQAVQPHGPYLIGGYSFGCKVAFEMASQLYHQKADVGLLVLLDSEAPSLERRRQVDRVHWLMSKVGVIARWHGQEVPAIDTHKLQQLDGEEQLQVINHHLGEANLPPLEKGPMLANFAAYKAHNEMQYIPTDSINVSAMLLYTESSVTTQNNGNEEDPTLGWSKFIDRPITSHLVPGKHLSMMFVPHVYQTADVLAAALDEAVASYKAVPSIW